MVTFTKDEIYTATEVVRNFSSVLSRVGASELKRAVIVKNNKFEAVLLNMEEYERLCEAVSVLESIYAAKKETKMASRAVKYGSDEYEISYEVLNPKASKTLLFLHGWGANKEIMKKAFGSYLSEFCHVYIDMPGFGKSSIFKPLKTSDYAKIVANFCDELQIKPDIIAGHSFGGKVATLLAPRNLVLLSSAGIVVQKPFSVRAKIAIFKILKIFGFGKFYKLFATKDVSGMSRVMYETLKNVVDEDFTRYFADFGGRAFIFWGENDKATPVTSGETIHKLIKNSSFFPLGGDHFFFLLHAKFISDEIEKGINFEPNEAKNVVLDDDESGIEEIR